MQPKVLASCTGMAIVVAGCCNCLEGLDTGTEEEEGEEGVPALTKTFDDEDLGFSIEYPDHWGVKRNKPWIVLISGHDESRRDYVATVNIQVIEHTEDVTQDVIVESEVEHFRHQFTSAQNGRILHDKDWQFKDADGELRKGSQMLVEYTMSGKDFKQLQFVLPGKDPHIVYTWAYTNHLDNFDAHLPIAETMLQSWELRK